MMDRREETKAVKGALVRAGYTGVRVTHGNGTAWGWLHVWADGLRFADTEARRLIQEATGRSAYSMENLLFQANRKDY